MRFNIKGEYFYQDRTLKSVDFFNGEYDDKDMSIYEVFRIEDSRPLFIEDHLLRLEHSLKVANKVNWKKHNQLLNAIKTLISANTIVNGNIKLDFRFFNNGDRQFQAHFLPSIYPNADQINDGIVTCFQKAERHHPTAKIYNLEVRGKANAILKDELIYETLLVNEQDQITEGSRSNLFFIINDEIITAPEEVVLPGIIRKKVIELAGKLNKDIVYKLLKKADIDTVDAAFITGTTPRILPIKQLDNHQLKVNNPLVNLLISELNKAIDLYKRNKETV
ncbi:aminotransferase class IV [Carboxylicivirga sp. N1Y90]|uniref:aminotransferase class IV n=1 Tax=Carboxylicivirga fragile TaxID=3417571 RepID=UPI003D3442E4|nr:aminotransferase class IV [Marinilabiliaceae bacterium N1Y90]